MLQLFAAALLALPAAPEQARDSSELVVTAPLGGAGVDIGRLPSTVESLSGPDLRGSGSLSVQAGMQRRLAGVSLSDSQGNAFTPAIDFRGFEASPLQGAGQGLAVYQNGVRINEAFGDAVNWDLIPQIAIARLDLITSQPAFGLNALGGAVALRMKTGAGQPGGSATLQGGSFGSVFGAAEVSRRRGEGSLYLAADGGHEDGWRLHSPSHAARAYGDIGWSHGRVELHLTASMASNGFGVVGPTPVDLLARNRDAIFTNPQSTRTQAALLAVNARYEVSRDWSVQAVAYGRGLQQHHLDGNDGNFTGCTAKAAKPAFDTLCVQSDGFPGAVKPPAAAFQVLDLAGAPIPCPPIILGQAKPCAGVAYGSLDRTFTRALSVGASLQATR